MVLSNKKRNCKGNYTIKILNDINEVNNILKENNYMLKSYKYDIEIYMVNKNEDFSKIKKIEDIKDYAIIKDENGNRKVLLKNNSFSEAQIHSIFLIHNLFYNLGYYELFYVNKDIYHYETKNAENYYCFEVLKVKDQGCFFEVSNISLKDLKNIMSKLKKLGISFDSSNLKIDIIKQELNKSLFKRK